MSDPATITEEQFSAEAIQFLEAHCERKSKQQEFVWGKGPDNAALFEEVDRAQEQEELAESKKWRAAKYDAGYGWLTGPQELGGGGYPRKFERVWSQLEAQFAVPDAGFFGIGLGMVAPTILAHAQPEVAADVLPKMYRADIVGCQLFSEPGAGSDLASLQMRADKDGEEWILNGQKVWTSGAHYSDLGEVIARTDADLPKHQGLTGFIVDMKAPGVEVRPLRQMTGGANFNEVYFNDVRVADNMRLGDINKGWGVALTTLMNERASIGSGSSGTGGSYSKLSAMLQHYECSDDPLARQQLMHIYSYGKVLSWSNQRIMDALRAGRTPGPEMSLAKMGLTRQMLATCDLISDVLGPKLIADSGEWGTYSWAGFVLGVPAMRIAGGSDEVMRNIVGERVLGLPKEPGIDTTSPFRELTVGTQRSE